MKPKKREPNTTEDGQIACRFGSPWGSRGCEFPRGVWPCVHCRASTLRGMREFHAAVQAGVYNERGYTKSEWAQSLKAGRVEGRWEDAKRPL